MARSIKCKRCGKTLLPEERYKYDNNSYCVDCYKKVERDANEYKELMRYIFDIFHLDKANGLILKQIKKLMI